MKKILFGLALAFGAVVLLVGCKKSNVPEGEDVPYIVAQNYFVNGNVEKLDQPIIDNDAEFARTFGMATTMGEDGKPTPIDWEKQFVIAVVLDEASEYVTIEPKKLINTKDGLHFRYSVKTGDEISYSMRPCLIVIVDKKYQSRIISIVED